MPRTKGLVRANASRALVLPDVTQMRQRVAVLQARDDPADDAEIARLAYEILSSEHPQPTQQSPKVNPALRSHLKVLKRVGLMTDAEAQEIDSYEKLCRSEWKREGDQYGVLDAVTQMLIENDADIVRLSDKRCYSKESMIEFLKSGTVSRSGKYAGRPILPWSEQPIQDVDYKLLGQPVPTEVERLMARDEQTYRSSEQLHRGDVLAWKQGTGAADPLLAQFLTLDADRRRLATQLHTTVASLLPPLPLNLRQDFRKWRNGEGPPSPLFGKYLMSTKELGELADDLNMTVVDLVRLLN